MRRANCICLPPSLPPSLLIAHLFYLSVLLTPLIISSDFLRLKSKLQKHQRTTMFTKCISGIEDVWRLHSCTASSCWSCRPQLMFSNECEQSITLITITVVLQLELRLQLKSKYLSRHPIRTVASEDRFCGAA